jgi:hypothetical protein
MSVGAPLVAAATRQTDSQQGATIEPQGQPPERLSVAIGSNEADDLGRVCNQTYEVFNAAIGL